MSHFWLKNGVIFGPQNHSYQESNRPFWGSKIGPNPYYRRQDFRRSWIGRGSKPDKVSGQKQRCGFEPLPLQVLTLEIDVLGLKRALFELTFWPFWAQKRGQKRVKNGPKIVKKRRFLTLFLPVLTENPRESTTNPQKVVQKRVHFSSPF